MMQEMPTAVCWWLSDELSCYQKLVAQIPWGHNLVLISKVKSAQEAIFYVQQTIDNNWSRAVLTHNSDVDIALKGEKVTAAL
jgi:predicted nuclease of restriction endonuclease-like (RecB) superfamily